MTFTLKSGSNRGERRIWVEGKRLLNAGLVKGTMLGRNMKNGKIILNVGGEGHRIAGGDSRPVLDLNGKWVTDFVGASTHVEITVAKNRITIVPVSL